jgi:transketolase
MTTMRTHSTGWVAEALSKARVAMVVAEIGVSELPRHPRVFNVGIREQLMIGVAAGLALEGYRPVVHSYAPFVVERPYEQIKLDLGHQDVGAILVSTGASYDSAYSGRTHQAPEDVAVLAALPGWTIHVPGHPQEVERAFEQALATDERVYIRLGRVNHAPVHGEGPVVLREGSGPLVLAVGPTLARSSRRQGISTSPLPISRPSAVPGDERAALAGKMLSSSSRTHRHLVGRASRVLQDCPHRLLAQACRTPSCHYGERADHRAAHARRGRHPCVDRSRTANPASKRAPSSGHLLRQTPLLRRDTLRGKNRRSRSSLSTQMISPVLTKPRLCQTPRHVRMAAELVRSERCQAPRSGARHR